MSDKCLLCELPTVDYSSKFCTTHRQLWFESSECARVQIVNTAASMTAFDDFVRRMRLEALNGAKP